MWGGGFEPETSGVQSHYFVTEPQPLSKQEGSFIKSQAHWSINSELAILFGSSSAGIQAPKGLFQYLITIFCIWRYQGFLLGPAESRSGAMVTELTVMSIRERVRERGFFFLL